MRNENSLKARVQRDAEFFKHLLADVPARQVLAMAQQKYPEASMYEDVYKRQAYMVTSVEDVSAAISAEGGSL